MGPRDKPEEDVQVEYLDAEPMPHLRTTLPLLLDLQGVAAHMSPALQHLPRYGAPAA